MLGATALGLPACSDDAGSEIESIVREAALDADGFALVLAGQLPASSQNVASILPLERLLSGMWDVFLIQDLGGIAGGFYFAGIPAVLSAEIDPFGQRELAGSAGRILAHELGHSLSLVHVPCTPEGNLMAAGCDSQDRTLLTATQVQAARQ